MSSKSLLPIAGTIAGVTALAVTVALIQPGSHEPRPLRLAAGGASGAERDASTLSAPSAAGSAGSPSGSGYTLSGTLPAGQPDDAPAYTLPKGPADADVVAALARALHAGTPVRDGNGWRAGGLVVSADAGQSWWFSPCAADMPVSSDPATSSSSKVGCAYAMDVPAPAPVPVEGYGSEPNTGTADAPPPPDKPTAPDSGTAPSGSTPGSAPDQNPPDSGVSSGSSGSGTASSGTAVAPPPPSPAPEPSPMSESAVRAAAKPVFDALGLDLSKARVEGWPYGGSAILTRTIGGLEAYGLQTSVQVDRDGDLQGAGGFLGVPEKGDLYPLLTALQAYDDLPPMMRTMMACPVTPDGKGCGEPQPTEITGARLGLMMQLLTNDEQALVPAWLFEVKGWTEPLPVVAVQAKYIAQPEPAVDDPATIKPEPPGGEVPPASTDPGAATPLPPSHGDPPVARQSFPFDKAARGDSPNEVVVTYGDSSSCPHKNVTAYFKETADVVSIGLDADAPAPNTACTDDYRAMQYVITLQAPLGDRKVIEAMTTREVPLS